MISAILNQEENETVTTIKELVTLSSPENFLQKIRSIEEDLTWDISMGLAKAISKCSEIFPKKPNSFNQQNTGTATTSSE